MTFDWQLTTLGSITDWSSGGTPKKDEPHFWGGDIPWISANSMHSSRCFDSDLKLTEEGLKGSRLAPSDAVLLLVRGGALHNRLPVCIATRAVAFNQDVKAIIAKNQFLRPWYLLYWLMGNERFLLDSVVEYTGIGAGKLDTKRMQALEFYLPPLKVQDEIIEVAKAIDDRIPLLRETNTTLENIAQSIFKSWFVDFDPVRAKVEGRLPEGIDEVTAALFPDVFEESELGLVPSGWKVSPIYEIAAVTYGAPFASKLFKANPPGLPLVRIRDLKDERPGVYTEEVHPKGYLIQPGDIVVGMDGEFRSYVWGGEEAWLNQRVCVFAPVNDACAAFVRLSITPLLAAVEASETATTVIHLGKNDIDRFKIICPTPKILKIFGEIVNPIYSRFVKNKQQIQTLSNLRDTLLPRLISGQLRISDAEAELEKAIA
jgi:type I restriction enzyme S subunit